MKYYQKKVYKDPRWKILRQQVIRRDNDICYFCKKMVLGRYATIHHIEEIDETNFSDESVAFNMDNLVLCHKECHDIHHERFGYKKSIVKDDLSIDYAKRG